MDLTGLLDWKNVIAALVGASALVTAFRIRLNINIDFNDIVDQVITYRRESKQSRIVRECPHVYPIDVNSFGSRPGFKSAKMINEDGGFICSMCGLTGYTTMGMEAGIEAYWSTRTWKDWGEKMERRNKIAGFK